MVAAAVVGSFPFSLVLVLRMAGLLEQVETSLAGWYAARGFGVFSGAIQPWWDLLVVAVLVYVLVWLLFETPGTGRRVLLVLSATIMVLALSPVLALWGIFWSPLTAAIGLAWGGICAIMWARQYPMPCELPDRRELDGLPEGKVIPMKPEAGGMDSEPTEAGVGGSGRRRSHGRGKARQSRRK